MSPYLVPLIWSKLCYLRHTHIMSPYLSLICLEAIRLLVGGESHSDAGQAYSQTSTVRLSP